MVSRSSHPNYDPRHYSDGRHVKRGAVNPGRSTAIVQAKVCNLLESLAAGKRGEGKHTLMPCRHVCSYSCINQKPNLSPESQKFVVTSRWRPEIRQILNKKILRTISACSSAPDVLSLLQNVLRAPRRTISVLRYLKEDHCLVRANVLCPDEISSAWTGELFMTTYRPHDYNNLGTANHNPTPCTGVQYSKKRRKGPNIEGISGRNMTMTMETDEYVGEEEVTQYARFA